MIKSFYTIQNYVHKTEIQSDEKREAIWKRQFVNRMYFQEDYSKRKISRLLEVSTDFVVKWTQNEDQDFEKDDRGWEKGRRRKWDQKTVNGIVEIRQKLKQDPDEPYWGPSAIEVEYRKQFPDRDVPPIRTIGKILSDMDMTNHQQQGTNKGALEYLHYPEKTIYEGLWDRVLEADFVGEKFISDRTEPINFVGYSFKKEPKIRHFKRIEGKGANELIEHTEAFFDRFERPEAMKVDNAATTIGSSAYPRGLSRFMMYLLNNQVHPIFSVPSRPATQASIEGSNAVFARKFWNRHEFETMQEIDDQLQNFNQKTRTYLGYQPQEETGQPQGEFTPKVFFTRQVKEAEEGKSGQVKIIKDRVRVPRDYISYFVLGEWDLKEEELRIRFERQKRGG